MTKDPSQLAPGAVVVITALDDLPEHFFLIEEVFDDVVTGVALTGPLKDTYGEPEQEMILKIVSATLTDWLKEHRKP